MIDGSSRAPRRNGELPPSVAIGGLIEIHGEGGRGRDWTRGCVALANPDIEDLFKRVEIGTPVTHHRQRRARRARGRGQPPASRAGRTQVTQDNEAAAPAPPSGPPRRRRRPRTAARARSARGLVTGRRAYGHGGGRRDLLLAASCSVRHGLRVASRSRARARGARSGRGPDPAALKRQIPASADAAAPACRRSWRASRRAAPTCDRIRPTTASPCAGRRGVFQAVCSAARGWS